MADYSYARLCVFAVADGTAAAVRRAVLDAELDAIYGEESLERSGLRLGQEYAIEELATGDSEDLANALHRLGATFELVQEPKYDYPGDVFRGCPPLGLYRSDGVAGSDPVLLAGTVSRAIEATTTRDELVAELRRLTGEAWQEVFSAAAETWDVDPASSPGMPISLPLPLCDTCPAATPAECRCTQAA